MTTEIEPALVDTNVLIYAWDEQAPQHGPSMGLLERAAAGSVHLCVTNQILLEYVSIGTNQRRMLHPLTLSQAWAEVRKFTSVFRLLPAPVDLAEKVERMALTLNLRGADVFDLSHAATAFASGVSSVYSYDNAVFDRVQGLTVRTP